MVITIVHNSVPFIILLMDPIIYCLFAIDTKRSEMYNVFSSYTFHGGNPLSAIVILTID